MRAVAAPCASASPPPRRGGSRSPRRASRARARSAPPDGWALRRVLGRVGLVQIDSVNVLARAHYLPLFSRLGPYPTELLDRAAHRAPRRLFEYWGHEASLLPVELAAAAALADGARRRRRLGRHAPDRSDERPDLVARVLEEVRARGPVAASEVLHEERPARSGPWWDWSDVKRAFEWLFWSGPGHARRAGAASSGSTTCPSGCCRPRSSRAPTPPVEDAQRELRADRRARAAAWPPSATCATTSGCPPPDGRGAGRRAGRGRRALARSRSRAGARPATCDPAARVPRRGRRPRAGRARSTRWSGSARAPSGCSASATGSRSTCRRRSASHGYYVLPFLLGDRLVARVDLKADRAAGVLRVQAAHAEAGAPPETARRAGRGAGRRWPAGSGSTAASS